MEALSRYSGAAAAVGAGAVGVCYVTSYAWAKVRNPATRAAREAVAALRAAVAAKDSQAIAQCLGALQRVSHDDENKGVVAANIDVVVSLLRQTGKGQSIAFVHDIACVQSAVRFLRDFCTKGAAAGYAAAEGGPPVDDRVAAGLVDSGGVRLLYRTMSRAYRLEPDAQEQGGEAAVYRDIVGDAALALERVTTVTEKVVMDFDVPRSARAAEQLAGVKGVQTLLNLLGDDMAVGWRKDKQVLQRVLGILSNVSMLRRGAEVLAQGGEGQPDALQRFLELATRDSQGTAYGSSLAASDQEHAALCVMHLLRYVRPCRERILAAAAEPEGTQGNLADSFVDLLDCARVGKPPGVSDRGKACRAVEVTYAALQCLEYFIDKDDPSRLKQLLLRNNDWGLVALFGIVARYRVTANPTMRPGQRQQVDGYRIRQRCRQVMLELQSRADEELSGVLKRLRKHNGGGGDNAKRWGAKFPIFTEIQRAETDDARFSKDLQKSMQKQQMQQQMFQQMMMGGGGGDVDEEQMDMMQMQMAMMGGMGGMDGM
eukprot:TRINITY_DN55833_c0_g1_i1.p1 TRINITY_DN55833_c0_g1~~TRINITY_DN55833_c0_g1_i1.p1  ORF type:complete len:573 (+),score=223.13 TRINITY_DN55833_c0_g1_i1:94-1719(+)